MSVPKSGVVAALWTPTREDGSIDMSGLFSNLEFLKDKGVTGFMILGSTGEFARLDLSTRLDCLSVLRHLAEEYPTVVNASAIRPAEAIAVGKRAKELGFGSVALLAPWFYALAQPDIAE
ncbi:MAG: dihydrodipicolinate synthase family protein, partial [Verrucomicrobiae bacterium]|nr:dihydrodipicolinate synthase family protein [Verrucomicrobiae bacterium]